MNGLVHLFGLAALVIVGRGLPGILYSAFRGLNEATPLGSSADPLDPIFETELPSDV